MNQLMTDSAFRSPRWWASAIGAATGLFLLQVWLPNLGTIWSVTSSSSMSLGEKVAFLWASIGALDTSFSVPAAWLVVAISILFGLNLALTITLFRRHGPMTAGGAGAAGVAAALLGVGCSSCGAVVLSVLVGTTASASLMAFLPLGGIELDLLAVIVLGFGLYLSIRRLSSSESCTIQPVQSSHPPTGLGFGEDLELPESVRSYIHLRDPDGP